MLNRLKSIKLRWSDLFLLLWGVFGALLSLEQNRFISYQPGDLLTFSTPFYSFVIYFILMIVSGFLYLLFEHFRYSNPTNKLFIWIIILSTISQLETILLSPNIISKNIYDINGDIFSVGVTLNLQVKYLHFFCFVFLVGSIYFGIFIFPKRINNIKIITYTIYVLYFVALALFIYSLCTDDYITLFRVLTLQEENYSIKKLCPDSIFGNPNLFGMFLEACIFLSILNYSITHKKLNLVLTILFFLEFLLTLCKAGILATIIAILCLLIVKLALASIEKDRKKIKLYLILVSSFTLIILSISLVVILLNEKIPLIGKLGSFTGRTEVWYTSLQLTSSSSFIYGVGYGIYNSLICNAGGHYYVFDSSITHNWFLAMLGEGGLLFVLPYMALIVYAFYLVVTQIKIDKKIAPIGCTILSFFIHSFFEDNYYLVIGMIVVLLIINNINKISLNNSR